MLHFGFNRVLNEWWLSVFCRCDCQVYIMIFQDTSIKWKKKNKNRKNAYLELNFTQLQLQETTKLNTTLIGNRKLHNAYNLMSWHFLTQTKRKDTTTKKKKLTKKKYNAKISKHKKMIKIQWHKIKVAKWEEWSTMEFMCRGHQFLEHEWWQ